MVHSASGAPRDGTQRRVLVLTERRYLTQPQPSGLLADLLRAGRGRVEVRLRGLGASSVVGVGSARSGRADTAGPVGAGRPRDAGVAQDAGVARDVRWADVVVARGRSPQVLAALEDAEHLGVPVLDRASAIRSVVDKSVMAAVLERAGLPTPDTWAGPVAELARRVPAASYPLIVKPVDGDNGRGLRLVRDVDELVGCRWPEPQALVQTYLPGDGVDLKLYGVGERVWAVRKRSPFDPDPRAEGTRVHPEARQVALTSTLEELARACSAAFGLTLYGVDCLDTPSGPVVVEVNDFPNYSAVPCADAALAAHVLGARPAPHPVRAVAR